MALQAIQCRDRAEWLDTRRRLGIGGSDAPAVVGVSSFRTPAQVYFEKRAPSAETLEDQAEQQTWGQILEEPIAQAYTKKTGRAVQAPGTFTVFRDTDRPWMTATLDRIVPDRGPLEIKNAGFYKAGDWKDEPPLEYTVQVQHQLAVTGAPVADLAVLLGGNRFKVFAVERNQAFIDRLIERERQFWRQILEGRPPTIDGSDDTREMIEALYKTASGKRIVLPPGVMVEWDEKRQAGKAAEKAAREASKEAENMLLLALGDAEFATLSNGATYQRQHIKRAGYTVEPTEYDMLRRTEAKKR